MFHRSLTVCVCVCDGRSLSDGLAIFNGYLNILCMGLERKRDDCGRAGMRRQCRVGRDCGHQSSVKTAHSASELFLYTLQPLQIVAQQQQFLIVSVAAAIFYFYSLYLSILLFLYPSILLFLYFSISYLTPQTAIRPLTLSQKTKTNNHTSPRIIYHNQTKSKIKRSKQKCAARRGLRARHCCRRHGYHGETILSTKKKEEEEIIDRIH